MAHSQPSSLPCVPLTTASASSGPQRAKRKPAGLHDVTMRWWSFQRSESWEMNKSHSVHHGSHAFGACRAQHGFSAWPRSTLKISLTMKPCTIRKELLSKCFVGGNTTCAICHQLFVGDANLDQKRRHGYTMCTQKVLNLPTNFGWLNFLNCYEHTS